jgi:DNA-binding Xre family transcriptional regulator
MTGEELKHILAVSGVSQTDIAKNFGVSQQNISSQLRTKDVRTKFLEQLCDMMHVTVDYFYQGTHYAGSSVNVITSGNGVSKFSGQNIMATDTDKLIEMMQKKDEQIDKLLAIISGNNKPDD